jgi:hypothetical protein
MIGLRRRARYVAAGVTTAMLLVVAGVLFLYDHGPLPTGTSKTVVGTDTSIISTATFTSISNSSDSLRFSLQLTHDSDGNLTISMSSTSARRR